MLSGAVILLRRQCGVTSACLDSLLGTHLLLGRAVLLGGASRFSGTHLVIPNRSELDVVTVLSDSQLALGAGAHHGLLQ
jgi:hypothetical protein